MSSPASDVAELSSVASALDELTRRVTAIAERRAGGGAAGGAADKPDDLATSLFQVERALREAHRRLLQVL